MRFCYTRTEDREHQKQIFGINVYCAVSNHNKIRTREPATTITRLFGSRFISFFITTCWGLFERLTCSAKSKSWIQVHISFVSCNVIRIPESGEFFSWWSPESTALECVVHLKESGILLENPESKTVWYYLAWGDILEYFILVWNGLQLTTPDCISNSSSNFLSSNIQLLAT